MSGVIQLAGERVPAGNGGHVGGGQCAGGHHTESGAHRVVPIGAHRPAQLIFVEDGRGDPGAAADITAQVEAVGDMVDVAQNFFLAGVLFGPVPLLLQLVGERIGVVDALHIATGAWVAVEEPRAAYIRACFEHDDRQPLRSQPLQGIQPGETGADHHHIDVLHEGFHDWSR
ncbi:Uncharacterised protein [Mycobacteroides abscessus subsp. abscessus]|nr:Uncharacterised protein [Mycobacteroides abscessus subsp. abscessus]